MGPVAVIVLGVIVDYGVEMPTTEDEYPIKTLPGDSAGGALGDCIYHYRNSF